MKNVTFVLDEAAMLGPMTAIDDALGIGRAYGVRLQLYLQSVGQLKKCFQEGQEQTLFSNTTSIFFGVNDNATADYVSARLGEETIIVDSGGTSSGTSYQATSGQSPSESSGSNWNSNQNWTQQARKLLQPSEVIALPPRMAITFAPGVRPILTHLLRFYEEKWPLRTAGSWMPQTGAVFAFVKLVLFTLMSLGFAALLTPAFLRVLKGLPAFPQ